MLIVVDESPARGGGDEGCSLDLGSCWRKGSRTRAFVKAIDFVAISPRGHQNRALLLLRGWFRYVPRVRRASHSNAIVHESHAASRARQQGAYA